MSCVNYGKVTMLTELYMMQKLIHKNKPTFAVTTTWSPFTRAFFSLTHPWHT